MNYYNEYDPKAAAWLRELIKENLISDGEVDERSIMDVLPSELMAFTQCHFFAGIGGWSYALRLAGWPDDRPVWTGSCPCQPFSTAGKGTGMADKRYLWPTWFRLIRKCCPITVFGEQVAAAIRHGWHDAVSADLEAEGYAVGACVLGAHSVGAPHIRQRVYFVADILADANGSGQSSERRKYEKVSNNQEGTSKSKYGADIPWRGSTTNDSQFWHPADWLPCQDGKSRPTQSGLFPLAHGVSGRVGLLRGAGNAIVPQVAAKFIKAFIEIC